MADDNLDKYLEGLGIAVDDDESISVPEDNFARSESIEVDIPDVTLEGDLAERAEAFLVNVLLNFDPSYAVEVSSVEDNRVYADIFGGDSGKIIGRNGKTLQAFEYLTNAVLNRNEEDNTRVVIDVGGYKKRRDDRLSQTARKAAERVRATGREYILKPMNAGERRIIHMEIADDPSVVSESTGQGSDRRVVIKPAG